MDREASIRERAHRIWEEEGCPLGQHDLHWQRACNEIDTETRQAGAGSAGPDGSAGGNSRAEPQSVASSSFGLVGADPLDQNYSDTMGVDDLNVAGDLSDPKDNWLSTGRSKLVGT